MSRTAKEIETTGLPCEAQNGETIQVVPKIDVTMFGKFTLKQEGMEVPHAVSRDVPEDCGRLRHTLF